MKKINMRNPIHFIAILWLSIFALFLACSCSTTKKNKTKTETSSSNRMKSLAELDSITKKQVVMDSIFNAFRESRQKKKTEDKATQSETSAETEETTKTKINLKPGGVYEETENGKQKKKITFNGDGSVDIETTTATKNKKNYKAQTSAKVETNEDIKTETAAVKVSKKITSETEVKKKLVAETEARNKALLLDKEKESTAIFGMPWWIWLIIAVIVCGVLWYLNKQFGWITWIFTIFKSKKETS